MTRRHPVTQERFAMETQRFDRLTRYVACGGLSRRSVLKTLGAALAGAVQINTADAAICRAPGEVCRKPGECCSGACGQPDQSGCQRCSCKSAGDCPAPAPCHTATCSAGVCGTGAVAAGSVCTAAGGGNGFCCGGRCVGAATATACGAGCIDCTKSRPANTVSICEGGACGYPCDTAHGATTC